MPNVNEFDLTEFNKFLQQAVEISQRAPVDVVNSHAAFVAAKAYQLTPPGDVDAARRATYDYVHQVEAETFTRYKRDSKKGKKGQSKLKGAKSRQLELRQLIVQKLHAGSARISKRIQTSRAKGFFGGKNTSGATDPPMSVAAGRFS